MNTTNLTTKYDSTNGLDWNKWNRKNYYFEVNWIAHKLDVTYIQAQSYLVELIHARIAHIHTIKS